jgi:hypothetical protein
LLNLVENGGYEKVWERPVAGWHQYVHLLKLFAKLGDAALNPDAPAEFTLAGDAAGYHFEHRAHAGWYLNVPASNAEGFLQI